MRSSTVFFHVNAEGVASERLGTVEATRAGQQEALDLVRAEARRRGLPEPDGVNRLSVAVKDWSETGRREYRWAYVPKLRA